MPGVLEKVKSAYILWHSYHDTLPKTQRYSLGNRIDKIFVELVEAVTTASFLPKETKLPYILLSIRKLDTLKMFLMILWETNTLEDGKYITLSLPLDIAGKMLGGWRGQTERYLEQMKNKQNPAR
ncbi:MAG: hypothetical protein A2832_01830 [Candidatus Zambryskibacteria bacterium RIFCSPHIGHO2_01_FULL_44_22b]|uniref:Four helix bundle protein n=1 Tax=Candidatus Zambryskibacteria bacterium RIFCSPHIGHO2_01_FULL_44_22b TaxID=1802737 RepID=A0A1G2SZ30_9BACT|nr:MAG: hypothetical protein A2832_01830 [Candidatus Zambryskibacteria bacterium RIFCSPHIGHO2_01_FULL_44_22b]